MNPINYAAQELANAEKEVKKAREMFDICNKLPPREDYYMIMGRCYNADCRVFFEDKTLDEVKELVETFPPMERVKFQDSCCSFPHKEHAEKSENGDIHPIAPLTVRCDKTCNYAPRVEVHWYSKLANGDIVDVEVRLKDTYQYARITGERLMSHGSVYIHNEKFYHCWTSTPGMRCTTFAAGSSESYHHYVIWWERETTLEQTLFGNVKF